MIKGNELRIGNHLLQTKYEKHPSNIIVDSIHSLGVGIETLRNGEYDAEYEFKYLKGVRLTVEVLEKCELGYGVVNRLGIRFINGDGNKMTVIILFKEAFFLHQLQNLYFAFEDRELVIKELTAV